MSKKRDPLYGFDVPDCDDAGMHRFDYPSNHGVSRRRLCSASRESLRPGRRLRAVVGAVLLALAFVAPGCVCVDTSAEVSELRRLHAEYRAAVVPLPHLDPVRVVRLGQRIDDAFAELERIEEGE